LFTKNIGLGYQDIRCDKIGKKAKARTALGFGQVLPRCVLSFLVEVTVKEGFGRLLEMENLFL
jgi:hypothetical protein